MTRFAPALKIVVLLNAAMPISPTMVAPALLVTVPLPMETAPVPIPPDIEPEFVRLTVPPEMPEAVAVPANRSGPMCSGS